MEIGNGDGIVMGWGRYSENPGVALSDMVRCDDCQGRYKNVTLLDLGEMANLIRINGMY